MAFFAYLGLAVQGIMRRKMRSWLTMIGIFIGVAAIVALLSLGQGMKSAILSEFEKVGANRIFVTPGGGEFGGTPMMSGYMTATLSKDDLDTVRSVNGVRFATGVIIEWMPVTYNDELKYLSVFGVETDAKTNEFISDVDFFRVESGRNLKGGDTYRAVIGPTVADGVFERKVGLGSSILIRDKNFKVEGIQKKSGSPMHDSMVRLPLDVVKELSGKETEFSTIIAETEGAPASEVAKRIERKLLRAHNLEEGEQDFTVQTAENMIKGFATILSIVQIVLAGIAAISLLVGGIGIMNTMYTAVMERTKEIGIMKAVGASKQDVLAIFLFESGSLGMVGGLIGLILGLGMSKFTEIIAVSAGIVSLKAGTPGWLIIGSLLFSFTIGCVSGLLPAIQAAGMIPVDALRSR